MSEGLVCPIEGCILQPWLDKSRESMQLCSERLAISRIKRHRVVGACTPPRFSHDEVSFRQFMRLLGQMFITLPLEKTEILRPLDSYTINRLLR